MNWKRISKEVSIAPTVGTYSDWKPQLSVEGFHQCVYCTISENSFGGIRNFHVEHYRPKGLPEFRHLENVYSNLFYACAICNSFKSNDWPAEPNANFDNPFYPDPSVVDYGLLFKVDISTGLIDNKNITGSYLINKLYLNRPQLIINRKESLAENKYQELIEIVKEQKIKLFGLAKSQIIEALDLLEELDNSIQSLQEVFHKRKGTIPYTSNHTKRMI